MVAGRPRMCMSTTGTPARPQSGSMPRSTRPAETSFTMSAPASSAAAATSAFVVSTDSGTRTAARTARSTGSSRARSSRDDTGRAPGRVDSAPTSRTAAPAATIAAAASAARAGSSNRPPSLNESGVALRTPMSTGRSSPSGPLRVASAGPRAGRSGRRGRGSLGPDLTADLVVVGAIQGFALEKRLRHLVEDRQVPAQQHLGPLVRLENDAPHLAVDLHGRALGVAYLLREVAAEEDLLLLLPERHRAALVAHAPLAHHLARQLGGALDVVARAGAELRQDQLLRRAPAEHDGEAREHPVLGDAVAVVDRHLLRQAERHAARDDGDLVHGIGAGQELGDQRVTRLVVGRRAALLEADDHRAPLGTHQDLVLGDLELGHADLLLVLARGEERRLVDQVLQVGTGEAGRLAGQELDVDVVADRHATSVHAQDAFAALHVGPWHHHATIEAAGTEKRRIEHVGPVGGGDQDDALVGLEAVHLHQELVERLLALVVAAAQAGAAMAPDRVDLVDEDDAGRVLLALHEEIAHPRRADADEHLDEVGAGDREERDAGLTGDAAREQRLACPGGTDQEDALRDAAAELGELLRVLQEGDDLFQLFLGLVDARHVGERHLVLVLGQQLGAALAERHRLAAADLHLAHEEDPHADQQQHGRPLHERYDVPGFGVLRPRLDLDALLAQRTDQIRILRREGLETVAGLPALGLVATANALALYEDLGHATLFHGLHEACEADFRGAGLLLGHDGPEDQPHQEQEQPKSEIPGDWVQ